jgi:hypothetical protein
VESYSVVGQTPGPSKGVHMDLTVALTIAAALLSVAQLAMLIASRI